ncbi:MAG TPA: archease, partial [Methanocorpusculum sp.]|nr:archease [Methanocorpusculum sp.]
ELTVNFLSELLFLTEVEYLVPMSYSLEQNGNKVFGTVSGIEFDRTKHSGGICVKGISYSGLSLEETSAGLELTIIFDI